MRANLRCVPFLYILAATLASPAQDRKPGLYDLTVTTTTAGPSPSTYPARTSQVCLTQAMIDKYGAIVPDNVTRICQVANVVKKSGGMNADFLCSGALNGKGTLEVNWSDSEHAKGVLNFSGTMHPGDKDIKIEWSATTNSVYKGADCGDIKPPSPAPSANPSPATPPPSE